MSVMKAVSGSGRDSANESPPICARARPHTRTHSTTLPISPKKTIAVEDLLNWAYCREKVHLARPMGVEGLRFGPPAEPRDSLMTMFSGANHGSMNLGFEAPADAYVVASVAEGLGGLARSLVIQHAKVSTRPDWLPAPSIHFEDDGPMYDYDKRRGRRTCVGHMVSPHGDLPEHVEMMRRTYVAWIDGLRCVRDSLRDSVSLLKTFDVSEELPPKKPWE
jgi:hypothetical protein